MSTELAKPLKLFYCYAREDKDLRDELDIYLSALKRSNQLESWSDREISPGTEWEKEIDTQLNAAHIILLLVTPHFMASDYCYGIEMKRAIERHYAGAARVIPLILRYTYWEDAPFSALQVLPTDAKPLKQWADRDEAFLDIIRGIRKAINELCPPLKTKEEWKAEGNTFLNLQRYDDAIVAYDQALRLDPDYADAWNNKGVVLLNLKRYDDAISAFDQALRLDPNYAITWYNKALALEKLVKLREARQAFEKARELGYNG